MSSEQIMTPGGRPVRHKPEPESRQTTMVALGMFTGALVFGCVNLVARRPVSYREWGGTGARPSTAVAESRVRRSIRPAIRRTPPRRALVAGDQRRRGRLLHVVGGAQG
jgi:hypothetical protein